MNRSLLDSSLNLEICKEEKDEKDNYKVFFEEKNVGNEAYDFSDISSLLQRHKKLMKDYEESTKKEKGEEESFTFGKTVDKLGKLAVILCYGGSFSIGVFEKEKCIFHKSDSRYINTIVLTRKTDLCNFLDHKEYKIVYKRFASLYFIVIVNKEDNELLMLEVIHQYVEVLDKYFGNVCELDIIYNFHKASLLLDEIILAGYIQESSRKEVLNAINGQENLLQPDVDNTYKFN